MDYKKLIGTIIGVTLFAVLIAGATFAWLTFGTTLGTNIYNGGTMNFVVDYTRGTNVSYLPILDSTEVVPYNWDDSDTNIGEASVLSIVMKKNSTSVDGHAVVKLTTTSTTDLTNDGVVRWAICRDTNVADSKDNSCVGNFENALNTGKITGAGEITLLNDAYLNHSAITSCNNAINIATATGCTSILAPNDGGSTSTEMLLNTTGTSYFIYFWLDGETITNNHLVDQYDANSNGVKDDNETEIVKNLYEGYIHASANQQQK